MSRQRLEGQANRTSANEFSRQIVRLKPFADPEVSRIVDGGLRSQGPAFLVVLLDLRVLVVHVQRGTHALGQHASPKAAGRAFGHAAIEDQLDLVRATACLESTQQVLTNDFLEEDAASQRPIQHLRQRELALQNRHVVAIARCGVLGRERLWQNRLVARPCRRIRLHWS